MTEPDVTDTDWWRVLAIFLAGLVISMVSFWMIESRHYVTRGQVTQTVEEVMGREEIMRTLARIESASEDAQVRVRDLERAVTRLQTLLETGRPGR